MSGDHGLIILNQPNSPFHTETGGGIAHAATYDHCAGVQCEAARVLLSLLPSMSPANILEPGCGTGLYTGFLLEAFPDAALLGLDLCPSALAVARGKYARRATFLQADAERFAQGSYDLITANAVYHWFTDLVGSLARMHGMLSTGGSLAFSYFGPDSYRELAESLNEVFGASASVTCKRFAGSDALADMLRAEFSHWTLEEMCFQQSFPSLPALLRNIRHTGTRGWNDSTCQWTPCRLQQVETAYRERFGSITVSYQVFFCGGQR